MLAEGQDDGRQCSTHHLCLTMKLLLRGTAAIVALSSCIGEATAASSFSTDMDAAAVADYVANEWKLPCLHDGLKSLHMDAEMMLSYVQPSDITSEVNTQLFPDCIESHWRKFWAKLAATREAAGVSSVDNSGSVAPQQRMTARSRRRLAQSAASDGSGIVIMKNDSHVTFGEVNPCVVCGAMQ